MQRSEKIERLKTMLKQIAPDNQLETLTRPRAGGLESLDAGRETPVAREDADRAVEQLERGEELSEPQIMALEAIVMPRERPVVFVHNASFDILPEPWSHLTEEAPRKSIETALPSVGRVELPDNVRYPYGGTGFVVGPDLLMTNRHVAEIFTSGLGIRGLMFRPGEKAAVDFKREKGTPSDDRSSYVVVRQVLMIHPYWDMAILRVAGIPAGVRPLKLSVRPPEELEGKEVAVIGYPARDDRNDLDVQDRIFERVYNVKRLQPGKIRRRERIKSFANMVAAMTHDSSTLGGNSGSAVLDVASGEIVGLHFAGVYLKANYAVPTYELARDSRVVDAGLNFAGTVAATSAWSAAWDQIERKESTSSAAAATLQSPSAPAARDGLSTTWTIPLQVSVTLGTPVNAHAVSASDVTVVPGTAAEERPMQVPVMYGNLAARTGYQPDFLDLDDDSHVPLPALTAAGRRAAAKLEDDSTELKYHKFSIVMHKKRRMALITASNVDWRAALRNVNGRKPSRKELTGIPDGVAEKWVTDPRIPDGHQLPDVFYSKDGGAFDKGHLVRRDDVCWGSSFDDMQMGNGDTYHTTNCSPQVAGFNQGSRGIDNWGDLELLIQRESKSERLIVFAGPIFKDDDPLFDGRDHRGPSQIQIPRRYWKIVVAKGASGPQVYGFVQTQDLSGIEFAVPDNWTRYMERVSVIEELLQGLASLAWLQQRDQYDTEHGRRVHESLAGN